MIAGGRVKGKRPRRRARSVDFLRNTGGGAVGLASVFIAMMAFAATAMVSDHALVVRHRDTMEAAVAAASIAATQQMATLATGLTEEEIARELDPLARRYILANLPDGSRERAQETLQMTLAPDREAGVVGISASADLGGAVVGRYLWGSLVDRVRAGHGAERVVSPVDLVLAIDVTGSMNNSILRPGRSANTPVEERRITVVKRAAQTLVRGLYDQETETGHVSVGLVPFNTTVNVGAAREDWVTDLGQGHKVIPPGFGPWRGCIEHRARQGDLDISLVTPDDEPFTSWFSPSTLEYRPTSRAALVTQLGTDVRGENDWSAARPHLDYDDSPHFGCPRDEVVPLTADVDAIERAIANLRAWHGGGTMTHLGVVWGRRLLASGWRSAWGLEDDREEPGIKKVLVLLSDGINLAWDDFRTYPGRYREGGYYYRTASVWFTSAYTGYGRAGTGSIEDGYRAGTRLSGLTSHGQASDVLNDIFLESCELAKDDGISVFTISAVPHGAANEQQLRERLIACATSADHAFIEHSEPERMLAAFREIGRMVQGIRRTRTAMVENP